MFSARECAGNRRHKCELKEKFEEASMNLTVYLAALSFVAALIAIGMRPPVNPNGETRKLEWVHDAAELRRISENSPYMRNER
jgi:hypothetical protein